MMSAFDDVTVDVTAVDVAAVDVAAVDVAAVGAGLPARERSAVPARAGSPAPTRQRAGRPAPTRRSGLRRCRAFSLLEMMVAIALLSLGLVLLLQVQARSIQLAQQAREMTIATQLARAKLLDCQADLLKKGFSIGDYDEEGDFSDEQMPGFYWECHAYKPEMPVADATDINTAMAGGALGLDPTATDAASGAGGQADPMMGMIAPIVAQMSSILGDSIRELHVIIRWGVGADMQEMTVTTHVIDKTAVNNVAAMIAQQAGALGALTGNPAPSGDDAGAPGRPSPNPSPRIPPRLPGGG